MTLIARAAGGVLAGLLALFLALQLVAVAGVGAILVAFGGATGVGGGPVAGGPVYHASCQTGAATITTASTRDLCHGPSDAARVARTIAAIQPRSPLVGRAAWILALGQRYGVDPLLIVQWQGESGMATVVPPASANGADNGGNLTWAAAEPYAAEWGCTPGAEVHYPDGSYLFARCPSVEAGLGVWFAYVAGRYPPAAYPHLLAYAETYNSCAYPGNEANGLLCGAAYARHILDLLAANAGPPATAGTGFWGITGRPFPITQGFGRTPFSESAAGRATYGYGTCYGLDGASHPGVDVGTPHGTPLYAPVAATVAIAGGSGYFLDETGLHDPATSGELRLQLDNGDQLILGHLSAIAVAVGQRVEPGQFVGRSGSANGAHVHIEVRIVDVAMPCGLRVVDPQDYFSR